MDNYYSLTLFPPKGVVVRKITQILTSLTAASVLLLSGCAHHNASAYLTNSASTANLSVPYKTKANKLDNDYPVPKNKSNGAASPSLVPPGLDLSQYKAKQHKH